MGTAIGTIGSAIVGGIANAQKDKSAQTTTRRVGSAGAQEQLGADVTTQNLGELQSLVGAGPGALDVSAAQAASQRFSERLGAAATGGLRPEQVDIEAAQAQLAPQQVAIQQAFVQEEQRARQLAARLNRPVNDPVIQAKLAQSRIQAEERLGAAQSQAAQQSSFQRLGFAGQLANVRQGLATQALQNRSALLGLGQSVQQAGQNFRLGSGSVSTQQVSGGGFGSAVTGAIAGAGAGANISSFFTGGDSGNQGPTVNQQLGANSNISGGQPELLSAFFGR